MSTYNANVNILSVLSLSVEFTPSNGALPRIDIFTFRLYRYLTASQLIFLVCDGIFVAFVVQLIYRAISAISLEGKAYFASAWNYSELLLILFSLATIGCYVARAVDLNKVLNNIQQDRSTFYGFYATAISDNLVAYMSCLVFLVPTVQFLRFLKFNKDFMVFYSTLSRIRAEMVGFGLITSACLIVFSFVAFTMLGSLEESYATFTSVMSNMFSLFMGIRFNYGILREFRNLGPLFTYSFTSVNVFILLNIVLSIISNAFSESRVDERFLKSEYEVMSFICCRVKGALGLLPPYIPPPPKVLPPKVAYISQQCILNKNYIIQTQAPRLENFMSNSYYGEMSDDVHLLLCAWGLIHQDGEDLPKYALGYGQSLMASDALHKASGVTGPQSASYQSEAENIEGFLLGRVHIEMSAWKKAALQGRVSEASKTGRVASEYDDMSAVNASEAVLQKEVGQFDCGDDADTKVHSQTAHNGVTIQPNILQGTKLTSGYNHNGSAEEFQSRVFPGGTNHSKQVPQTTEFEATTLLNPLADDGNISDKISRGNAAVSPTFQGSAPTIGNDETSTLEEVIVRGIMPLRPLKTPSEPSTEEHVVNQEFNSAKTHNVPQKQTLKYSATEERQRKSLPDGPASRSFCSIRRQLYEASQRKNCTAKGTPSPMTVKKDLVSSPPSRNLTSPNPLTRSFTSTTNAPVPRGLKMKASVELATHASFSQTEDDRFVSYRRVIERELSCGSRSILVQPNAAAALRHRRISLVRRRWLAAAARALINNRSVRMPLQGFVTKQAAGSPKNSNARSRRSLPPTVETARYLSPPVCETRRGPRKTSDYLSANASRKEHRPPRVAESETLHSVVSDLLPGASIDRNRSRTYSKVMQQPEQFLRHLVPSSPTTDVAGHWNTNCLAFCYGFELEVIFYSFGNRGCVNIFHISQCPAGRTGTTNIQYTEGVYIYHYPSTDVSVPNLMCEEFPKLADRCVFWTWLVCLLNFLRVYVIKYGRRWPLPIMNRLWFMGRTQWRSDQIKY